jgi:hypothetical protein
MPQVYVSDPSPSLVFSSLFPPSSPPPRYARKTHIHHANLQNSPLLRLPPEIRTLIWQHLLSMSPVHLTWSTTKGLLRCGHCSRPQTGRGNLGGNHPCLHGLYPLAPVRLPNPATETIAPYRPAPKTKSPPSTPLSALLVSRHLHSEISSFILSACTLLIDSPYAFYAFFKHLSPLQRSQLASLHLLCESAAIEPPSWNPTRLSWNRVLHPTLLAQLTGLRALEISVVNQLGAWSMTDVLCWPGSAAGANVLLPRKSRGFLRFRELRALRGAHGSVRARIVAFGVGSQAAAVVPMVELGDLREKILGTVPLAGEEQAEERRFGDAAEGGAQWTALGVQNRVRSAKPRRNVWRV